MPSPSNRRTHDPLRPPKARTRHTAERELRKERGTPEKSHSRTPKRRTQSPERSPTREQAPQKRTGSPERRRRRRSNDGRSRQEIVEEKHESYESTNSGSALLSADALAQLNTLNETTDGKKVKNVPKIEKQYSEKRATKEKVATGRVAKEKVKRRRKSHGDERRRVSGPLAEEGGVYRRPRGGYVSADERRGKKRFGKKFWIFLGIIALLLIIFIPVGIVVSKKSGSDGDGAASSKDGGDPSNDNLKDVNQGDIPVEAKNTILDPFIWYDTSDFNVTYTKEEVGGLPIMGLNSEWDDSTRANDEVPPLDKKWDYGKMPIRGINVGGWLAIEPFITPSLFSTYKSNQAVIDEYTLTSSLGPSTAAQTLEKHYAKFITESDFKDIQTAGFDHVRIPYSYWAVTTYPGDPYVPKISWRYLLRGIEYCRKYGLRVNLDLHGLPGSQNGWNHSGRQGPIGWLNGTEGSLNAQRSLDIHTQLSTFFAQPRYANIITIYGLANEPKMTELSPTTVNDWTTKAAAIVRKSGMNDALIAFGDGFLGLEKWQGQLQGIKGLILDAHEYVIFDPHQISMSHKEKIDYACKGWTGQMSTSTDTATGFGPTLCGEWSQADTDCATYLNNVGVGTRWEGTLRGTEKSKAVLTPSCPGGQGCSCAKANAKPEEYDDGYRDFLLMNAEGQMSSFEKGWGWFYWTWRTEGATQWDYRAGMAAGILPKKTWDRKFDCSGDVSDFKGLSENY